MVRPCCPLTATFEGFTNGDTPTSLTTQPTLSTTATVGSPVGTYPIIASAAVDADYTISYVVGTLTITPAPLTITADGHTKVYGAALPTLTASYTGFVNDETFFNLTTQPTLTTNATASSPRLGQPLYHHRQWSARPQLHDQLRHRLARRHSGHP